VLSAQHLSKHFGGVTALDDVSISVQPGIIHAIVGSNGAGKSTLLNLITGQLRADTGTIHFMGRDVTNAPVWRRAGAGFGRAFQVCQLFDGMTVEENLWLGAATAQKRRKLSLWARHPSAETSAVDRALEAAHLTTLRGRLVGELPQGDRKRVEIALTMAMGAVALCLDEPLAGVAKVHVAEVIDLIRRRARDDQVAVVIVEHDVDFVFSIADVITVMHNGKAIASGPPEVIREDTRVREIYFAKGFRSE
jgi:branched-chain amino acid transport system ATP-binding protein